jgi:hypothetical protein
MKTRLGKRRPFRAAAANTTATQVDSTWKRIRAALDERALA